MALDTVLSSSVQQKDLRLEGSSGNKLKAIPQLDSIRFFAAFGVIFHHFIPDYKLGQFEIGAFGVQVFFAISGFLITFILLQQKEGEIPKKLIVRNFFIKRALRLFPIYFFVIVFFHLLSIFYNLKFIAPEHTVYYYTYSSNILFFLEGFQSKELNHTWTLAIEEQFYLIWPWIIIFLPAKKECLIIIMLIIISLISKAIWSEIFFLPIAHFDTLGIGALLAYLIKYNSLELVRFIHKYRYYLFISSCFSILLSLHYNSYGLLRNISLMLISSILIICSYYGFKGIMKNILDNKILQHLGKISYGLYLYHKFIPLLLIVALSYFNLQLNNYLLLLLSVMTTIIVSHLSYIMIEKKLLSYKQRFDL